MIKRRRLGTTYTRSPAQNVHASLSGNFSKLLFTILICVVYLAVLYVAVGVVRFLGTEIAEIWDKNITVLEIYNNPYCIPVKVGGIIFIIIYVFRDKMTNR
ncbi:MAG: hypothetical protein NT118_15420 [Lentisphaerae bacterium]|nr:hypothetical protein [Lentisphaerota bacterium]